MDTMLHLYAKCADDADKTNALGVIALREGKTAEAAKLFTAAGTETAKENLAVVDVLNFGKAC